MTETRCCNARAPLIPIPLDSHPPMCIIHIMKSADIIRELKMAGWVLDRVRGSHHVFTHPDRGGHVTVPHPKKDLGKGLVAGIRKQAGI
jgi:predicted RNA binding protein YcfA (HicA-like mRNA interferase family)